MNSFWPNGRSNVLGISLMIFLSTTRKLFSVVDRHKQEDNNFSFFKACRRCTFLDASTALRCSLTLFWDVWITTMPSNTYLCPAWISLCTGRKCSYPAWTRRGIHTGRTLVTIVTRSPNHTWWQRSMQYDKTEGTLYVSLHSGALVISQLQVSVLIQHPVFFNSLPFGFWMLESIIK